MKCKVTIEDINTIQEIENAWTNADYVELLDMMEFPDANKISDDELLEMLFMVINELKPHEAAEIILTYKFSDMLTKGQIENLAHEMVEDSANEEFADISMHYQLFNINRLLYKAYNGKVPNTKASVVNVNLKFAQNEKVAITKEILLKAVSIGLSENNLVKRLFAKQLTGKVKFVEANSIIWEMEKLENGSFSFITSDYWINEEDFNDSEFEGTIHEFEEE